LDWWITTASSFPTTPMLHCPYTVCADCITGLDGSVMQRAMIEGSRNSIFYLVQRSTGGFPKNKRCHLEGSCTGSTSAKKTSVWADWLHQSGRTPSEPSETAWGRITPRLGSMPRVTLHIALQSQFHHFFSLGRSALLNEHSGVVVNCDHTLEWVQRVRACMGIAMRWVTLRKSLLMFLLPATKMQFSLY